LQESSDALEENERLKQTIKHKEERVRILQVSLDQIRTNKKLIPLKVGR
jgi:hypothetical protein